MTIATLVFLLLFRGALLYSARRMDPSFAGKYIASLALRRSVKPEYAIGLKYKFLAVLAKLLPCRLRNYIIGLLYAQ